MAYAPAALMWLADEWDKSIPSAVISGIVGDSSHTRGYHRSYNELPASDYSKQLEADRIGIDVNAADALDMSMNTADMKLVTRRFYDSWKNPNDRRLDHIREVIGTLDGSNVIYMDTQSGQQGTADSSHLWHVHVGGLRRYANDYDTMRAIISVVRGESLADTGEDEDEMALLQGGELRHGFGSGNATVIAGPALFGGPVYPWAKAVMSLGVDYGEVAVRVAAYARGWYIKSESTVLRAGDDAWQFELLPNTTKISVTRVQRNSADPGADVPGSYSVVYSK